MLSPGFTHPRSTLTALAEELASHGYVVAGIDHIYESHATAFPDGRVTTCLARQARRPGSGFWEKVVTGRAADVSFVLTELTGTRPPGPGAGLIDPSRMAMAAVGHDEDTLLALALTVAVGVERNHAERGEGLRRGMRESLCAGRTAFTTV